MPRSGVLIAGAIAALALTGCGGSSKPLTAVQLARKIPGCTHVLMVEKTAQAKTAAQCDAPGSDIGLIQTATFSSAAQQQRWVMEQEEFAAAPAGGCCVEGHLWAAFYLNSPNEFPRIIKALGGHRVSSHL